MAPTPANDLTEHMCQRAGPAARVDGHLARLRGRSRPSCRHSRMEAVGDATRLGPSEPRRASRKLPTRSAHEERKPGRLPREGWLHRARWASSLTPVAARASTGCRDEQSTCPTCARTPLSHRRRGSGTRHERRGHLQLRRAHCSQLAYVSRWRSRLRRAEAAATLQRVDGLMPDLERGVARAASHSRFTKRKHRS